MKKPVKKIRRIFSIVILMLFALSFLDMPSAVKAASIKVNTPTSVKAQSSSYSSINVSWKAVSGATGYAIYRATSSKGTYTLLSSTTNKSYNNTGLKTGTTYYYKIRGYKTVGKQKVYGSYSSVISSKPVLSVPASVKSSLSSYNSINVSWGAVSGASGYELYRAASSTGTYTLLSSTTGKSYSNTGLKTGTTYYYKVRAYRTVGSAKVYSSFSSIVKMTTGSNPVVNVSSISLNKTTDTLTVGNTDTLTATVNPSNAANKSVNWTSSANTIATVDNTGKITAVSAGTATITAVTVDGSKTASCIVTVNAANTPDNTGIKGIDVSKWEGTIDWSLVKSDGVQFAMIRSSYGSSSTDPMFENYYAAAKANGIAVGVYHYSYATTVDQATKEANFFVTKLKGKQFEYPVCLDIEDPSQEGVDKKTLTSIATTYMNILSQAGYYPMVYTDKYWLTSVLDDTMLTSYDHWLAEWGTSITYPGKVGIWQYTSTGTVKGINGSVDMDTSYVDYATKIKSLHLNGF